MAFIDYENPEVVLGALRDQVIKDTYIRLLEDIYKECKGRTILHKQNDKFQIRKEVRRGDVISPKLFRACVGEVFGKHRITGKRGRHSLAK